MNLKKIEYGIHTIELYKSKMKYTEVQKVLEHFSTKKGFYPVRQDTYNIDRMVKSNCFVEQGIRIRIHQSHNKSNGIGFAINPSTLLSGTYEPLKLYSPTPQTVSMIEETIEDLLDLIPCHSSEPSMANVTLSYLELTCNLHFSKDTDLSQLIRLFRKSYIPHNFARHDLQQEEDTRNHYFSIKTKGIIFKAYDKIYELKKYGRCPKGLKNKTVLRLELGLKRTDFLKKFKLTPKASLLTQLQTGYQLIIREISAYLKKLFPCTAHHVKYHTAKKMLVQSSIDADLKQEMLYLLKKTSDSATLSTATHKLKDHYSTVDKRRLKKLYQMFDSLGVNPVTISKHSAINELPNIQSLFRENREFPFLLIKK